MLGNLEAVAAKSMASLPTIANALPSLYNASLRNGAHFNPTRRRFCVVAVPSRIDGRLLTVAVRSRASLAADVRTMPNPADEMKLTTHKNILACPICFERLIWKADPDSSLESVGQATLKCCTCRKSYSGKDSHLDLTINGGNKVYGEPMPASTEIFRLPVVSFLYERGWRQTFSVLGGFPALEKEFEMIKSYLKPVLGGNIIDASCGSGMFSRLFAKSGLFSSVVALDFSESMLKQCYDFVKQEDNFPEENLILVRADISRLPFTSTTVDAVHAGAAIHCWPSPSAAVAEISRVLKPGGIFVASTLILNSPLSYISPRLQGSLRQSLAQISGSYFFSSEKELEDLCTSCGLVNFTCTRNRFFVMITAMKPV